LAHALSEMPAQRSQKWSDFGVRAASSVVLGPIALLCLWHGGWAWAIFIGVAMAGLGYEWGKLAGLSRPVLLSAMLLAVWLGEIEGGWIAGMVIVWAMTAFGVWLIGRFAGSGIPYAGIGGVALLWLRLQPGVGFMDTLFLIIVVWSTDIGAYVVGRMMGGAKLAPKISPGKTWSGSVGGLLIGGLAGALLAGGGHGIALAAIAPGFLLSVSAQGGDLLESAIKRKLGVKDSGNTIPGHGGLFDRLDGFLAAAPVAAVLALCVHGGLPLWG